MPPRLNIFKGIDHRAPKSPKEQSSVQIFGADLGALLTFAPTMPPPPGKGEEFSG